MLYQLPIFKGYLTPRNADGNRVSLGVYFVFQKEMFFNALTLVDCYTGLRGIGPDAPFEAQCYPGEITQARDYMQK